MKVGADSDEEGGGEGRPNMLFLLCVNLANPLERNIRRGEMSRYYVIVALGDRTTLYI
jgi:hypothetical protein